VLLAVCGEHLGRRGCELEELVEVGLTGVDGDVSVPSPGECLGAGLAGGPGAWNGVAAEEVGRAAHEGLAGDGSAEFAGGRAAYDVKIEATAFLRGSVGEREHVFLLRSSRLKSARHKTASNRHHLQRSRSSARHLMSGIRHQRT